MNAVKLHFQRGLRIGALGWGLEEDERVLGADVLYSALHSASIELTGEGLPDDLRISSGFPFVGEWFFFPRPQLHLRAVEDPAVRLKYGKAVKELRFVERRWFLEWLAGGQVDLDAMLGSSSDLDGAVVGIMRPRVSLDRLDNASSLYFSSELRFSPGAGMYCLVTCAEPTWRMLTTLFRYVGDVGVGGEKTSGLGAFEPEFCTLDVPAAGSEGMCVTLSPVIPQPNEISELRVYELKERGGWVSSSTSPAARKKRVCVVAEGSVFSRPVRGSILDVAPDGWPHRVLRYGLGLYARVG